MANWQPVSVPDTGLTVTPFEIFQRLRLRPGRDLAGAQETMQRWFLRIAKRNNCGIALSGLRLEDDNDPSRCERAIIASVDVFKIPADSGMEPGYVVDVPDASDFADKVQKSLGEVELAEGDPPPAYS